MPKTQTPAPIDRPLSRAYLREFSGWSTAYPPGISEPTSLRLMENTQVMRDGALRIRPGLRYLSYLAGGLPTDQEIVGTHEPFFLNNGNKAYLLAVREDDGTVGFRVLADTGLGQVLQSLTAAGIDFDVVGTATSLNFSAATSYVKYLQIDNKIFALSNAGEPMRYFTVGSSKTAKRLNSIERPAWSVSDKLTVVQPTQAWIASGVPIATRTNMINNPQVETDLLRWDGAPNLYGGTYTRLQRTNAQARVGGSYSAQVSVHPYRTNYVIAPLAEPAAALDGWHSGSGTNDIIAAGGTLAINGGSGRARVTVPAGGYTLAAGTGYHFDSPGQMPVERLRGIYGAIPPVHWVSFDFHTNMPGGVYEVKLLHRWWNSSGVQVGGDVVTSPSSVVGSTYEFYVHVVPSGAVSMSLFPYVQSSSGPLILGTGTYWEFSKFSMLADPESTGWFDGDSGADYGWFGTPNASASYHAPGFPVEVEYARAAGGLAVSAGLDYTASVYTRAMTTVKTWQMQLEWRDAGNNLLSTDSGAAVANVNSSWATRISETATAPPGAVRLYVRMITTGDVEFLEDQYLDQLLVEQSASLGAFFDGSFTDTSTEIYSWTGTPNDSDSTEVTYSGPTSVPGPATTTGDTLIGDEPDMAALTPPRYNSYNFGFFYTFSNEVGESAPSQVTVVKAQRGWSQWKWETANGSSEPSGTKTDDPNLCADQLVAYMPSAVFLDALDQGAIRWSLYMMTWSDQDPVPVQAVRLATRSLVPGAAHGAYGHLRMTPQQADANAEISALPSEVNRFNYSTPSSAGQGIVAADRLVLVFDPASPAVVRWSSAQMGNYADFTGSRGGGFKTLSSGNMYVPSAVVLWQNPQSADTITILCQGTDGKSTGYYMAPAQIASQSEAVNIMGFEETTATPGTVSPFGVEVFNNALYHPLDDQLMKSTATNYNINHMALTDPIQNVWVGLVDKHQIVSAVHDNRIYYLVHNPLGAPREEGCWGNEVWVFDAAQKAGTWSRWLVQGQSLRRIEVGDSTYMSITRPDGIYYFDPEASTDDFVSAGEIDNRSIPWLIETNTQGANRAHDAWAHVQQVNLIAGNFLGTMKYGIRGLDIHGKMQTISKLVRDFEPASVDGTMWDLQDFLLIRKDLQEWFFFASSVLDDDDEVLPSSGQLNLVQYRYTPSTVNTGYEYGSVETFEYGRAGNALADRNTTNGTPMPFIDTGRP